MEQFAAQIWQQQELQKQQQQQQQQQQPPPEQQQQRASEQLAAVELNELQKQEQQKQQQQLHEQHQTSTALVVDNNNKLAAIEATIIDIPLLSAPPSLSCTTTTASAANALKVKSSTTPCSATAAAAAHSSALSSTSSSTSTSYDTDSSTTSSTCCTRHGEHIYMEKAQHNKMQQQQQQQLQQQQQQQQQHHPNHHNQHQYACNEDPEACDLKAGHRLHWPLFMLLISIIEVAIFAYDSATVPATATTRQLIANMPIPSDSVFIYRPDRRLQVWRFLSYMFLHANWFHLGFNVVIQLFYGIPLEMMHGSARIAIVYCAGVFAGALGTSVVDSEVYLVGASGGVYAILAAHLANLTLNYRQMRFASVQLLAVLIFVNCDLGYALYTQYLDAQIEKPPPAVWPNYDPPPVSYVAHMTGALAGFTIGLLVLKNFEHRPFENLIWWLALGVYSAFTVFAIVFNLINTITGQLVEERSEVVAQQLLYDLGVS